VVRQNLTIGGHAQCVERGGELVSIKGHIKVK
jgi:hypothetical protein